MSDQQTRDAIEHFLKAFSRQDLDAMVELMHGDVVEEYPQSGERIQGKHNVRTVYENYPGLPKLIDSTLVRGELCVLEAILEYESNRVYICEILEVQDGKIKRLREYFCEPFEAPEWRAQWVEKV